MEDSKIVQLYWDRSNEAIPATSEKYGRYCNSIALNILGNWEDAEECVNDTYLSAWNSMPLHRTSMLSTFLGKITRNLSINKYKYKNQLKNPPVSMDMDVQYEFFQKLPYDVWQMVLNDFHTLMGISYDDFILKVPAKWSLLDFYSLSTRGYKDSGLEEDYRMHDYVFEYQTENSGSITIALCSFEQPLRDCFFECKNPKVSNVYGIEIMVYQYENTFFTEFKYEDVYYDIETNGVGIEEVQELLKNILTEG